MIKSDNIKNGTKELLQNHLSHLYILLNGFKMYSEHDLQKRLNQALDQLTDLRQSHDDTQAQLIGHDQKYGKLKK